VSGADNQQERPSVGTIPVPVGSFLSGFALGEGSFMLVCRQRGMGARRLRISAAFNVSQHDREPLDLFRETVGCGTMRRAGSGGWYWEVNRLSELSDRIVPFFDRFPIIGRKAGDYRLRRSAVLLRAAGRLDDQTYMTVLALREQMNRGGKRRYRLDGILRDYTPSPRMKEQLRGMR
jgi:hypothetical protein